MSPPSLHPSAALPHQTASNISYLSSLSRPFRDYTYATNHLFFFVRMLNLISKEPIMPAAITHLLYFSNKHLSTVTLPSLLGENIYRDISLYAFKSFLNISFFSEVCKSPENCPAAARIRPLPNMLTGVKLFILNPFCMQVSPPQQTHKL